MFNSYINFEILGSPWRDKISLVILDLQEKGVIELLYNKWWRTGITCSRDEKNKEGKASALGIANIGGVFVVLLSGLSLALVTAICEFFMKSKEKAQSQHVSLIMFFQYNSFVDNVFF